MGMQKKQDDKFAGSNIQAQCQGARSANLISLHEVNTTALNFQALISVQLKKSLIRSIKYKQIWKTSTRSFSKMLKI